MKFLYHFFAVLFSSTLLASAHQSFEKANALYNNSSYEQASRMYEQLLDKYSSKEVYFNLGNCYYHLKQVGKSIYAYEKALQLDENFKEAKFNLAEVKKLRKDKFLSETIAFKGDLLHSIVGFFSSENWAFAAVILSFSGTISFFISFLKKNQKVKKVSFVLWITFYFLALLGFYFAQSEKDYLINQRFAVVMNTLDIKSQATFDSKTIMQVHEGTKLFIDTESIKWFKIILPNGSNGWILKQGVKEL